MVHGSPRPESNEDVFAVVEELRSRRAFDRVEVGFLDVNQPDIPTAVETLVTAGAREIVAVPYFLHSGKHVSNDLPDILEAAARRHPAVLILMGDYLGHAEAIADVLRDRVGEAVVGAVTGDW
jgi:sirohydrochlorin ferrochelatase